jgi:hypothetical protein
MKEIEDHLKRLKDSPQDCFTEAEIKHARKLSKKIENVQKVTHDFFGEGIVFMIDGRQYGIYKDSVKCFACPSNCIHILALAFRGIG